MDTLIEVVEWERNESEAGMVSDVASGQGETARNITEVGLRRVYFASCFEYVRERDHAPGSPSSVFDPALRSPETIRRAISRPIKKERQGRDLPEFGLLNSTEGYGAGRNARA